MPRLSAAFRRRRGAAFVVLSVAFMIAFFHRVSPTVIADVLMRDLDTNATALGWLAAMYFWVYTLMQVPAGVLADRIGPRISVAAGSAIAGGGSLLFAAAPGVVTADIGRLVIGLGVASAFVGMMKFSAVWFDPRHYGRISGLIVLLGNFGAVLGASPLAWVLTAVDWRTAFAGLGVLSMVLAAIIYAVVRDTPARAGFPGAAVGVEPSVRGNPGRDLLRVAGNRCVWPFLLGLFTIVGSFFAFTGLWAVPFLQDSHGLNRQAASDHVTIALLGFAFGSFAAGWFSDRLGRRKPVLVAAAGATLVTYLATLLLPWQAGIGSWLLFAAHGLAPAGMVVCYAGAKESVVPAYTGMAIAFVNTGLFLGAAILQPAFGLLLDAGGGDHGADDYARGLWLLTVVVALGLIAVSMARETLGPPRQLQA